MGCILVPHFVFFGGYLTTEQTNLAHLVTIMTCSHVDLKGTTKSYTHFKTGVNKGLGRVSTDNIDATLLPFLLRKCPWSLGLLLVPASSRFKKAFRFVQMMKSDVDTLQTVHCCDWPGNL